MMRNTRGFGNVYRPTYRDRKTGELKECATYWVVYHVNGKRIAQNAHTIDEPAARRFLKKCLADAGAGLPVGPEVERTTLDQLIFMVEADYKFNSRRSLNRVQAAGAHLQGFFSAQRRARDITADQVTSYAAHRLDEESKPATVNYELATLRRGFRLAFKAGKCSKMPEFSMLHVNNTRKGYFEYDQLCEVLQYLPEHLTAFARVAYITGWRKGELLSRQWRHIDFSGEIMRLEPGETKNNQGREFPFTPDLRRVLITQREQVREIEHRIGRLVPWVFCLPNGERIGDFRKTWASACRVAGVPGRLVHDFRRTAVRNLERAGVPRSSGMKLTGHKTLAVYDRYAIVDESMAREAAAKLAALHAAEAEKLGPSENRKSIAKVSGLGK
jgi:integrase